MRELGLRQSKAPETATETENCGGFRRPALWVGGTHSPVPAQLCTPTQGPRLTKDMHLGSSLPYTCTRYLRKAKKPFLHGWRVASPQLLGRDGVVHGGAAQLGTPAGPAPPLVRWALLGPVTWALPQGSRVWVLGTGKGRDTDGLPLAAAGAQEL